MSKFELSEENLKIMKDSSSGIGLDGSGTKNIDMNGAFQGNLDANTVAQASATMADGAVGAIGSMLPLMGILFGVYVAMSTFRKFFIDDGGN